MPTRSGKRLCPVLEDVEDPNRLSEEAFELVGMDTVTAAVDDHPITITLHRLSPCMLKELENITAKQLPDCGLIRSSQPVFF